MLLAFCDDSVAAPSSPSGDFSFGKHIPSGFPFALVSSDTQDLSEKWSGFLGKLLWTFGCALARGTLDPDEVLVAIQEKLDFSLTAARATEAVFLRQFTQFVQRNKLLPTEMCADSMSPVACSATPFVSADKREISCLDIVPDPFMAFVWLKRMVKIA